MVRLRHINGSNLSELEGTLGKIQSPLQVVNVNKVGDNWYIHFLLGDFDNAKPIEVKQEPTVKTKTIKRTRRK